MLYFSVCEWRGKKIQILWAIPSHSIWVVYYGIAWVRRLIRWLVMAERIHMFNCPQAMYCLIRSTTLTLVQTSRAADALLEGTCVLWSHSPLTQLKLFTLFHISVKEYVYFQTGQNCHLLVERDASVLGPGTTNSFPVYVYIYIYIWAWGSVVVKALRFYSDGPGIDSRWCHWGFFPWFPWGRLSL